MTLLGHGEHTPPRFWNASKSIYAERSRTIGTTTMEYWRRAIT